MTKEIIAAALGFVTMPLVIAFITAFVFGIKYATEQGLSSAHYWGGFWSLIGIVVIAGIAGGLFFFVTEFRNL